MPVGGGERGQTVYSGRLRSIDLSVAPLRDETLLRSVRFDHAQVEGVEVCLDEVSLSVVGSEFDDCTFKQRSRRLHRDGFEPQGSFGNQPGSVYRRCSFIGVRMRIRAGFSVDYARFEDCVFDRCKFTEMFSRNAEFVNCVFLGPIKSAAFHARRPDSTGTTDFVGNDFTSATLSDNVAFRGGIDLSQQRFAPAQEDAIVRTNVACVRRALEIAQEESADPTVIGRLKVIVLAVDAGQTDFLIGTDALPVRIRNALQAT